MAVSKDLACHSDNSDRHFVYRRYQSLSDVGDLDSDVMVTDELGLLMIPIYRSLTSNSKLVASMEESSQAHAVQKLAFIHKAKTRSVSSLIIYAYMKVYDHRIVDGQWWPS